MSAKVQIGSVSSGTLRTEDLLDAFASELARIQSANGEDYSPIVTEANDLLGKPDWTDEDQETADELVNELQDALSGYAPAHTYFGAHVGDGADFGFWPYGDFERCERRVLSSGRNGEGEFLDLDCGLYVSVNDHGNITVSTIAAGDEVWSAV